MDGNIIELDSKREALLKAAREAAQEEESQHEEPPPSMCWLNGTFINHAALLEIITEAKNSEALPARIQIGWRVVIMLDSDPEDEQAVREVKTVEGIAIGVHSGVTHDFDVAIPVADNAIYVIARVPDNCVFPMMRNADK